VREPGFVPVPDMTAVLALLAEAEGGHVDRVPDIDLDAARLARALTHGDRRLVGLLPASACDVPSVALAIGLALGTIAEAMVVVLLPERPVPANGVPPAPGALAACLGPSVVAIAPLQISPVGEKERGISALLEFIESRADSWRNVLIDLTSCELPGELLATLALLDGIIIVGRAGRVTESDLARAARLVPQHLSVGVLLHE